MCNYITITRGLHFFCIIGFFALFIPFKSFAQTTSNPFIQNLFNPDISIITDTSFVISDIEDDKRASLEIPGFLHEVPHTHSSKTTGFNFNYLELAFSAPVDPYFDFLGVTTFAPGHGVELEEIYVNTRGLPLGFNLRAGLIKTAFGRHAEKHAHTWDFYDAPLVYESLLGSEGLNAPGIRLYWTLPFNFFLQIGGECMQGYLNEGHSHEEEASEHSHEEEGHSHEEEVSFDKYKDSSFTPFIYSGYIKTSFDFGNHIFLFGPSIMYGSIWHEDTQEALSSEDVLIYGFDLTYKYIIDSYRYVSLESELLGRRIKGNLYTIDNNKISPNSITKDNIGSYFHLIWKFTRNFKTGLRYDLLFLNNEKINKDKSDLPTNLARYAGMVEYNFTEFSRLRLQYNYDRNKYLEEKRKDVQEVILQLNIALGPHGAHKF